MCLTLSRFRNEGFTVSNVFIAFVYLWIASRWAADLSVDFSYDHGPQHLGGTERYHLEYEESVEYYNRYFENEKAVEYYEKALAIVDEIEDKSSFLEDLDLVYESLYEDNTDKAIEYFKKALDNKKKIDDKKDESVCIGNLGSDYESLDQDNKAIEHFKKELDIVKDIDEKNILLLGRFFNSFYFLDEYDKAIKCYDKALDILKEIDEKTGEGRCLEGLGDVYKRIGEYDNAVECYKKALDIKEDIGEKGKYFDGEAYSLSSLDQYDEEILSQAQKLDGMKEISDKKGESEYLYGLGKAYSDHGRYKKAIEYYNQALDIMKEIGDKKGERKCLRRLCFVYQKIIKLR